jgi:hypothetical protein
MYIDVLGPIQDLHREVPVSVFSYFLPKGKKFASGKKKAFSILAKIFALLLLTFGQVYIIARNSPKYFCLFKVGCLLFRATGVINLNL